MILVALILQLLAPILDSSAFSAVMPPDRIAVCSAAGVHYIATDGDAPIAASETNCVFCLPLLGGHLISLFPGDVAPHPRPATLRRSLIKADTVAKGHQTALVHPPRAPPAVTGD